MKATRTDLEEKHSELHGHHTELKRVHSGLQDTQSGLNSKLEERESILEQLRESRIEHTQHAEEWERNSDTQKAEIESLKSEFSRFRWHRLS